MTYTPTDAMNARLSEIETAINKLEAEKDEILSAKRVIERYSGSKAPEAQTKKESSYHTTPAPRPKGIPTVWEMTEEILLSGPPRGLSVKEIVKRIEGKWWPGVILQQVSPTVYSFAKQGRLIRPEKGTFALPKEKASESDSETSNSAGVAAPTDRTDSGSLF